MFDMRTLPQRARDIDALEARERRAIEMLGAGASPHEVALKLGMDEAELFRLVAGVLDETEPPGGPTLVEAYAGVARPATAAELVEFEAAYGASNPADDEG